MWQSNGFRNFPPFFGNFNIDDHSSSPQSGSSGPPSAGPYSFQQHNPSQEFNSGGYMNDGFGIFGLYDEKGYLQNQAMNPGVQYSTSNINLLQPFTPSQPRAATQINARAAELKAQLLKGREDRATSTPPVVISGIISDATTEAAAHSSLKGSRRPSANTQAGHDQESNINELISQYSESKGAADTDTKPGYPQEGGIQISDTSKHKTKVSGYSKNDHVSSIVDSTNSSKPTRTGKEANVNLDNKGTVERLTSSYSESEGEIIESPLRKTLLPAGPKKIPASSKPTHTDEHAAYRSRNTEPVKPTLFRAHRDSSPPRRTSGNPQVSVSNSRNERGMEPQPKTDKRSQHEPVNGRRSINERDPAPGVRRDSRSYVENQTRADHRNGQISQQVPKTDGAILADLVTHDENLREWLEITGYHNAPYRDKILNRRRAIAALDAQREKLLAEMEAEERVAPTPAVPGLAPFPSMLPPPLPSKVPSSADSTPQPEPISKPEFIQAPANAPPTAPQRERVVSNKRPYSDIQEKRIESLPKAARMEDRNPAPRVKQEDAEPPHISRGFDTSRRSSLDRYDDHEPLRPRYEDIRGRRQGDSRERTFSPAPRIYDDRGRGRAYDSPSPEYFTRDERSPRGSSRRFVVRGNYRGRSYDPSYRGRGRGAGRGDHQSHLENRTGNGTESRTETSLVHRAAVKPYKGPGSFTFGGRGETRFFIVKSFNETNVLRCMEDSIWTTQVQNGPVFTEAFNTSRILTSPSSSTISQPPWQISIHWSITPPFRVHWIVRCWTPFSRVCGLKNPLNENLPVSVGKDGQEVEEACGRELGRVLEDEVGVILERGREGEGDEEEV